jgi:O-antigen/teichoic acid export membrane protein
MPLRHRAWFPALTPHRRRQIWYGPVLAVAMALTLLRLLVYARHLGVDDFGRLSAGMLVSSGFCMLGCLGLMPMLQREWPVRLVNGQRRRGWIRALQCACAALGVAAVFLALTIVGGTVAGLSGVTLALALVHGLGQQLFLVVTTESRSAGDTLRYALQQLARGVLLLGGGWALAWGEAGADVVLAYEAGVTLWMALAIALRAASPTMLANLMPLAWRAATRPGWRTALTMMAVMLLSFAMVNVERWLAAELMDHAGFGLYAFAAIVLSAAQAGQALVNASGYPIIARRYASGGASHAFRVSMKLGIATFVLGAMLLLPLAWGAQWSLGRWYAQYSSVAPLLPWLALIGLVRAADFWSSFLVIAGHESLVLRLNAASLGVALAGWAAWIAASAASAQAPASYVVLAAAVTAIGTICNSVAAWRLGVGRCTSPQAPPPPSTPRNLGAGAP